LMAEKRWYFARPSKAIAIGTTVFFYQSSTGIVGESDVAFMRTVTRADHALLNPLGLGHLTIMAEIKRVIIYPVPLHLREHVADLRFINNKVHWGQSLRLTPRVIDSHDAQLLRVRARKAWR
jgi:hypothetical protein